MTVGVTACLVTSKVSGVETLIMTIKLRYSFFRKRICERLSCEMYCVWKN